VTAPPPAFATASSDSRGRSGLKEADRARRAAGRLRAALTSMARASPLVWRRHYVVALQDAASSEVLARLDDLGFEVIRFEERSTWPGAFERLVRVLGRTGMTQAAAFSPGTLVSARGREWMVLAGSTAETLRVRPISGSEEDQTLIYLPLEPQAVREARFPVPDVKQLGGHDAALLLRDALLLSMRRGAGPFRSFGQIAVEPRAYQLVPLLMALKLDPVRLLIADDVGVGKTIEAALILREMLDRGDIERSVVLVPTPPRRAVGHRARCALQPASLSRHCIERQAAGARHPAGMSLFQVHPHTVVSLDYIKSQERRAHFLHHCPGFVIVDEAHACVGNGQGHHQRYDLLRALADSAERHMVLLTATPHSGDDTAFYRLLGLLDRSFEGLQAATEKDNKKERDRLRERLGNHFVQRRRVDIAEWQESGPVSQTRDPRAHLQAHGRVGGLLQRSARLLRGDRLGRREQRRCAADELLGHARAAALRCVEPDGRRPRPAHARGRGTVA
jgi:hypothetical protein